MRNHQVAVLFILTKMEYIHEKDYSTMEEIKRDIFEFIPDF